MEEMDNKLKRKGSDLSRERSLRIPRRPPPPSPQKGQGKAWENLGSTQYTSSKVAPSEAKVRNQAFARELAASSDDEMDCLSSASQHSEEEASSSSKSRTTRSKVNGMVVTHPPARKLPDFKKRISSSSASRDSSVTPSTSLSSSLKETRSHAILSRLKGNENDAVYEGRDPEDFSATSRPVTPPPRTRAFPGLSPLEGTKDDRKGKGKARDRSSPRSSQSRPSTSRRAPLRETSPNVRIPASSSHPRPLCIPSEDSDSDEPTPRPKPSRVRKARGVEQPQPALFPVNRPPPTRKAQMKAKARARLPSSPAASRPGTPEPKLQAAAFPSLPPLNSPPRSPPTKGKGKGKMKPDTEFPVLSPLKTPRMSRKASGSKDLFPMPSPLSSPVQSMSQKTRGVVKGAKSLGALDFGNADDENSGRDELVLQPFPMELSELKSLDSGSSGMPTDEVQLDAFPDLADESMFDTDVDPSTLCPYCDEALPPTPTPHFNSLLAAAKRKSYAEPRPGNARGLKAPLAAFVAVCQRHRFEAHEIPKARAWGWPTTIDFDGMRKRVERVAKGLRALVKGEGDALAKSMYWTAVMAEVQAKGSRAVAGVKGQFENFEKTQPGYYGELGSMILHHTIYNIYPPSSFQAESIAPLTPPEFIQRILVPETAVALIMEDMKQGREDAARTMRESATYGVAMFPDDGEGSKTLSTGAGEDIVRERALARRKELDVEERVEEAMLREAKPSSKPRPKRVGKNTKASTSAEKEQEQYSSTDVEEMMVEPPKAKGKAKQMAARQEETDHAGYTSRGSNASSVRRSTRAKTRASGSTVLPARGDESELSDCSVRSTRSTTLRNANGKGKQKEAAIEISDDDEVQIIENPVVKSKPRPRPVVKSATMASVADDARRDVDETPKASRRTRGGTREPSASREAASSVYIPLLAARNREHAMEIDDPPPRRYDAKGWKRRMGDAISVVDSDEDDEDDGAVQAHTGSPVQRDRARDSWLLDDMSSQSSC